MSAGAGTTGGALRQAGCLRVLRRFRRFTTPGGTVLVPAHGSLRIGVMVVVMEGSGSNRPTSDRDPGWSRTAAIPTSSGTGTARNGRRPAAGSRASGSTNLSSRPGRHRCSRPQGRLHASTSGTAKRARQTVTVTAGFGGVVHLRRAAHPRLGHPVGHRLVRRSVDVGPGHRYHHLPCVPGERVVHAAHRNPSSPADLPRSHLGRAGHSGDIAAAVWLAPWSASTPGVPSAVDLAVIGTDVQRVPIRLPVRPNASVGWGLIVLLVGALGAVLCALSEAKPT